MGMTKGQKRRRRERIESALVAAGIAPLEVEAFRVKLTKELGEHGLSIRPRNTETEKKAQSRRAQQDWRGNSSSFFNG